MTVIITKPAVNLREELASLNKPTGIVGESILRADTAADAVEQLNLEDHTFTTFTSTGIDDNATSTKLTVSDTGIDVTGTVTADGLTLGDSDKAIFGAGSDLQIYHDGNNSIIDEVGTGNLYLRSSNLYMQNVDSDPDEMMISASANGAVTLSHNGVAKIATTATGVAVTGTVTAGDITSTGNLSSNRAAGHGAVEVGGPSGGLIDLKAPFSDDYDARIIYNAGADLQINTLAAGEPILLRQGNTTRLNTSTTGVSVTGKFDATTSIAVGTAVTNGAKLTMESGQDNPTLTGTMATGHFVAQTSSGGPALNVGTDGDGTWYNSAYSNNAGIARNHRWLVGGSEAMQIDASGNVLVGTTTTADSSTNGHILYANGAANHSRSGAAALSLYRPDSNGTIAAFWKASSNVGTISVTGSATAYNTSSDYRLKENITPVQGAVDIVKAMQPVTYTFKSDGSWHDGFLAHELQELHPRAVTGSKDAVDEEGNPEYQGVDYSKLTPILTAALQEALNKIDALEARLTALEAV